MLAFYLSLHSKLCIELLLFFYSGPTSKFRHIQGTVMHRDTHITNIRGLNLTTPGECDGFCVNRQRVAVPLAISGGQIAVFEVQQQKKNRGMLFNKTADPVFPCS